MDIQTCPRRMREMGPWPREEGQDEWREDPRREDEAVPYCSFCGSLHPGKFLELVAEGWEVGPTDKDYKAYLHSPRGKDGEQSHQIRGKFYYQHLSIAQQQQFVDLYNRQIMQISYPGYFYAPPFFMQIVRQSEEPEGGG